MVALMETDRAIITILLAGLLLVISVVDVRRLVIPNSLNLCLLLLGLAAQFVLDPANLIVASAGAALLFTVFAIVRYAHHSATGRIGLGFGDVKMAGAAGVWLGVGTIPAFMLIASLTALVAFGLLQVAGRFDSGSRLPFGPFLAISLFACWISPDLLGVPSEPYLQ